jgi:hypothetical protein
MTGRKTTRRAKSPAASILAACLLLAVSAPALDLRLDGSLSWRRLNDAKIHDVYGDGVAFTSGFEVTARSGWAAGLRFESAAYRKGVLGLSASDARFRLMGLEATAGRELRLGAFGLYARAGLAVYHYKQTVDYVYVQDYKVDRLALGGVIAVAVRAYLFPFLYFTADAKYVVLPVKPYGQSVDLSGIRLGGGLGLRFGPK